MSAQLKLRCNERNSNTVPKNPELEILRNSVKPIDNTDIINAILPKIANIHAAFLFHGVGLNALQKLCLCLSSTKQSLYYSGWKDFAIELGLTKQLTDVIEYNQINSQDPTYNVIFAYVQYNDSTIDKILKALQKIGRWDVIAQTEKNFLELSNKIHDSFGDSLDKKLLKPSKIPQPPLVLANLKPCEDENKPNKKKLNFSKVVMLTYTSDSIIFAQMVANELRKEYDGKRIGVIILQEQAEKLNLNPEKFISNCFSQSHYIIPILSTEYLNLIYSCSQNNTSAVDNLDNTYAQYIYSLMSNYYIRNGCMNNKIRCIVADHLVNELQKHPAMINSVLRIWVNMSQIETFANRILTSDI